MSQEQATSSAEPKDEGSTLKADFLASVVVFLVALPLCMGIAIASGVPVAAGLITGIVGGIVVGALSGCPLQVSGPAAGLTVIIYDIVQKYGVEMLGVVVLIGGVIQLLAGIFKLGQWFRAVSPAVIKGMLAGIGVLIFASQFHVMVDDKPRGSGLQNLIAIPEAIGKGLGVPNFETADTRKFRTEMLKKVGLIHRRQDDLYEKVSEVFPHHGAGKETQHHDPANQPPPNLSKLEAEQQKITADLAAASRELDASPLQEKDKQKLAAVFAVALQKSETALTTLKEKKLKEIPDAQVAAVGSLESLLGKQKNHHFAALLGLLTIVVILAWQTFAPKKWKILPAPLIAVVAITLLAFLVIAPVLYVEVPDNLFSEMHFPTVDIFKAAPWTAFLQMGILIAVVASAETLLCATAVDQMQSGSRTKYDKELFAQGVGNMICGAVGALPMTGVIVRSSANIQAGGKTRLSAILHGIWLLIFVAFLAFLLRLIPTACLAGILVYTGYKLITHSSIKDLKKYGWGEVVIFLTTIATIVAFDLLTGVLVGIGLAAVKLLYTFSHLEIELRPNGDQQTVTMEMHGAATFVRLPKLATELEKVPAKAELHVDLQHLEYIDHACLDLLMTWAKQHESTGGKLVIDWESLHARFYRENNKKKPEEQVEKPNYVTSDVD